MVSKPASRKEDIRDIQLTEALSERYLAYAMSTIVSRSLPDVRDGLKPVHRRLLFAMRELKLDPTSGFKKCARVVGDVIGKYHPHGDAAVYDALVRLAQDFSVRYPLVEGQGNFGNIDGDNAAAMRYTEARLTPYAEALMEGLDENAADFRPTYDGEEAEPVVMPAAVPNVLANGATGIAVGMATSIPPHNIGEICDALLHLIKCPKARIATLVNLLQGPDFPTGGILMEDRETVVEAYQTGRASFRVRAKWQVEKKGRGLSHIVVTEIPFQVQKSKVIERIAELLDARKLPLLANVRDESAEDMRIVLEPRSRSVELKILMEHLFRQTDLETRSSLNLNVLSGDGIPQVMNLKEVLEAYLHHRHEVLVRRSRHRLEKITLRLTVLNGYLIAFINLDAVIKTIREDEEPKAKLMREFNLADAQAEAILNLRLRSLRKLEEIGIQAEHDELSKEKRKLNALLRDKARRWKVIADQIKVTKKTFGQNTVLGKRRTELGKAPPALVVPIEALVEKEPVTILLSRKGWIRALKGHQRDVSDIKFKDGDALQTVVLSDNVDKILFFGSDGRFYSVPANRLPQGRGYGEPVRLMTDLGNNADVVGMQVFDRTRKILVISSSGRGFVVPESQVYAQTRIGKQILNLGAGEKARVCAIVEGDSVAIIGENRKLLIVPLSEVPEMNRGRGVILQRYKDGETSDAKIFTMENGLSWQSGGRTRTISDLTAWMGKRSSAGRLAPKGFPRNNRFA